MSVPALHLVAHEPAVMASLPLPVLVAVAAQACAEIATRLATEAGGESDRLLTAEDAAPILGLTPRYLRRHAHRYPFTKRPSKGRVRFSERGIQQWIARKRA